MKILKIYIADDGTKFDNQQECVEYEDKLKKQKFASLAFLYNENGERLPLITSSFDNAYYLVAKTSEAAAFMHDLFSGWMTPWCYDEEEFETGCWAYVNDAWISAESILEKARIIKQII